jgi:drug/metabolite transporter (DMT)-like permease
MGLFCALGTLCFYIAVKHTSAANVSQYHYTQLVTGTLVSYLTWHNKPGFYVLLGGILILASGLYIAVTSREMPPLSPAPSNETRRLGMERSNSLGECSSRLLVA